MFPWDRVYHSNRNCSQPDNWNRRSYHRRGTDYVWKPSCLKPGSTSTGENRRSEITNMRENRGNQRKWEDWQCHHEEREREGPGTSIPAPDAKSVPAEPGAP
ncbi:unnamed protein product [Lepidochelys kempii]